MEINLARLIKKSIVLSVLVFTILFGFNNQRIVLADTPPSLVFDRGLPTANLNLNADSDPSNNVNRSNDVVFSGSQVVIGDDFTIGASGEIWIIDKLRVWTDNPEGVSFSEAFTDLNLYGSKVPDTLIQLMKGNFTTGNTSDNPDIQISRVKYNNGQDFFFGGSGEWTSLYQVDFNNLNWTVDGGGKYQFGIHASGKPVGENMIWVWDSHISNKDLSGSRQDGADDLIRLWPNPTAPALLINLKTEGAGDKPSDVNVQIWAHKFQNPNKKCRTINNRLFTKEFCITIPKKPVIVRPKKSNDGTAINTDTRNDIIIRTGNLYINKISN